LKTRVLAPMRVIFEALGGGLDGRLQRHRVRSYGSFNQLIDRPKDRLEKKNTALERTFRPNCPSGIWCGKVYRPSLGGQGDRVADSRQVNILSGANLASRALRTVAKKNDLPGWRQPGRTVLAYNTDGVVMASTTSGA
jgi:hypothetical protein